MVAIHTQPREVNLHRFFWRELEMLGARLYERRDFEAAVEHYRRRARCRWTSSSPASTRSRRPPKRSRRSVRGGAMKILVDCTEAAGSADERHSTCPAGRRRHRLPPRDRAGHRPRAGAGGRRHRRRQRDARGVGQRRRRKRSSAPDAGSPRYRADFSDRDAVARLADDIATATARSTSWSTTPGRSQALAGRRLHRRHDWDHVLEVDLTAPVRARPQARAARWSSAAAERSSSPPRC